MPLQPCQIPSPTRTLRHFEPLHMLPVSQDPRGTRDVRSLCDGRRHTLRLRTFARFHQKSTAPHSDGLQRLRRPVLVDGYQSDGGHTGARSNSAMDSSSTMYSYRVRIRLLTCCGLWKLWRALLGVVSPRLVSATQRRVPVAKKCSMTLSVRSTTATARPPSSRATGRPHSPSP